MRLPGSTVKFLKQAAETFREGLTTVRMCWVAIHTENRNFAISVGSNQAITIGGVDAAGKSAVNRLTYVILKSITLGVSYATCSSAWNAEAFS